MVAHKRRYFRLTRGCIVLALVLASNLSLSPCDPARAKGSVLVLYDNAGEYGWVGRLYVQHMLNLLAHFEVRVDRKPVEEYISGDIDRYDSTIYLGVIYDNVLLAALGPMCSQLPRPFAG